MNNNSSKIAVIVGFFIISIALVILMIVLIHNANKPEPVPVPNQTEIEMNESEKEYNRLLFDYKMIRKTNNYYNGNYLISPLALASSLKILEDGASGETRDQISNLIKNYDLSSVINIDKKISVANALFINTTFKGKINANYTKAIEDNYSANIMYDSFTNAEGINNWISGKTFGNVTKAFSSVNRNAIFDIVNTIALNIDWKQKMSSANTHTEPFTKIDKTQMHVAMMHDENSFGYLENENAKGIVKHYAVFDRDTGSLATNETLNSLELEYIAIIPKVDINDYINNFDHYELSKLLQTVKAYDSNTDLVMNIPKYSIIFSLDKYKDILIENKITKAFEEGADFSNIYNELILSDTIHTTVFDFGEEGTYSAPVSLKRKTEFPPVEGKERIQIDFNTPFIYLVKEKNGTNLWLFGVVYEPTSWDEYNKLIEQAQREEERRKRGY